MVPIVAMGSLQRTHQIFPALIMRHSDMKRLFYLPLLLIIFSFNSDVLAQSGKRSCDLKIEDAKSNKARGLPPLNAYGKNYAQLKTGLAPFSFDTKYGDLYVDQMFRSLGGYYCDSSSIFTLIYHSNNGLTVVGHGFEKIFPLNESKKAIEVYLKLISERIDTPN